MDEYAKIAVLESQIEELRKSVTAKDIAIDILQERLIDILSHIRFTQALKEDTLENRIWHMVHNWCTNTNPTIPDMARRYLMDEILDIVQDQLTESNTKLADMQSSMDIARDGNSQTVGIILDVVTAELVKQESEISNYMNQFMTQGERDRHGDNIMGYLCKHIGMSSLINLNLMARWK